MSQIGFCQFCQFLVFCMMVEDNRGHHLSVVSYLGIYLNPGSIGGLSRNQAFF